MQELSRGYVYLLESICSSLFQIMLNYGSLLHSVIGINVDPLGMNGLFVRISSIRIDNSSRCELRPGPVSRIKSVKHNGPRPCRAASSRRSINGPIIRNGA